MVRTNPVRRPPDSGVATAVSSVIQHEGFKRMLMFGLRSLSDLCVPPALLYKENSIEACSRGVVPTIVRALHNFPDEDLAACAAKVLWGISEGIKEENDLGLAQQLSSEGGVTALLQVVKAGTLEPENLQYALGFIENLAAVGLLMDEASLSVGLVTVFRHPREIPLRTARCAAAVLSIAAQDEEGAHGIKQQDGLNTVLDYALEKASPGDGEAVRLVEIVFDLSCKMAKHKHTDAACLEKVIKLMEKFKAKRSVVSRGSAALSCMVGPEQLHHCLELLRSAPPDSTERDEALTMLSSMSYIASYTDDIVKSGGVAMLIDLIRNGVDEYTKAPSERVVRLIAGASRMLGRIASNPASIDAVVMEGGLRALDGALRAAQEGPGRAALGAVCEALVPLANGEGLARELYELQIVIEVIKALREQVEDKQLSATCMELMAALSQHVSLREPLMSCGVMEVVCRACTYHTDNATYQLNALTILNKLSSNLTSLAAIGKDGLGGIAMTLEANSDNDEIALAAVQLMEKFSYMQDAKEYMCDGTSVGAILEAMLVQEDNPHLLSAGSNALIQIASEIDCTRQLENLDRAIQGARGNPDAVYTTLAAISGLSRVPHLRNIFEDKRAAEAVTKGVSWWSEGAPFDGQCKVIKAGIRTAKTLKIQARGDVSSLFVVFTNIACTQQVRKLVEGQAPDDNVLMDIVKGLRDMCEQSGRIAQREGLDKCVEGVIKIMRKYQHSRKIQIICLNILKYLSQYEDGVASLTACGAINMVVGYLNRAPMYLDAQIAGFTTLAFCVREQSDDVIEAVRQSGGLQALTTATRTHGKSKDLKRVIAPLAALLMPADHLYREIQERLANISEACTMMNLELLNENLVALNDLLVSIEGSKMVARLGGAEVMGRAGRFIDDNKSRLAAYVPRRNDDWMGEDFYASCLTKNSQVIKQMAQSIVGRVACTNASNVLVLITNYKQILTLEPTPMTEEGALHTLDALRLLMRHDRNNVDYGFRQDCVRMLCEGTQKLAASEVVLSASCACLASMATSPSRVDQLISQAEFRTLLQRVIGIVEASPSRDSKLRAVEALVDLLGTKDPSMVGAISDAGAVSLLFATIEHFPDDRDLTTEAAKCLAIIGNYENLRSHWKGDVRHPSAICSNAVKENKSDAMCCEALLDVFNKMTTADDKDALKDAGCLEVVAEVMIIHSENAEIIRLGGELFAKMGADEQIKALMLRIITTVDKKESDYIKTVSTLASRLATFLASPIIEASDALQYTEDCLSALKACLVSEPNDVRFMTNCSLVTRRLCDRAFDSYDDPYGAIAFTNSQQLDVFISKLAEHSSKARTTRGFLIPAYRCLSATAANPTTQLGLASLVRASSLLTHTYVVLELHKNDAEVVARIFEFLRFYASVEEEGNEVLGIAGSMGDIIQTTLTLAAQHRRADYVFVAACGLLGQLAFVCPKDCHVAFTHGTVVRECESLMGGLPSDARQLAEMGLVEQMVAHGHYKEPIKKEKVFHKIVRRLEEKGTERWSEPTPLSALYAGLARMLTAAARGGVIADVERCRGLEAMERGVEELADNGEVIVTTCDALIVFSEKDENLSRRCLSEVTVKIVGKSAELLSSDAVAADVLCDLLLQLLKVEGNGRSLVQMDGLQDVLKGIQELGETQGDDFGAELNEKVIKILRGMLEDHPKDPTCKDVYELLITRKENRQSINVYDFPFLGEKLSFVFAQASFYAEKILDHETVNGTDYVFGCKALSLFSEDLGNIEALVNQEMAPKMLTALPYQLDERIVDAATRALRDLCRPEPLGGRRGPRSVAAVADSPNIVTEITTRLWKNEVDVTNILRDWTYETIENLILARLQLIERMGTIRNIFNSTKVMSVLIGIWNDCDNDIYSLEILNQVFRTMRSITSYIHVDELLRANVLLRLKLLIKESEPQIALLPDVLFLLGSLAVVSGIKDGIGEFRCVEACVRLILRVLHNPRASPVIANACLALANINLGHMTNINTFININGPFVLLKVLEECGLNYDVTNAVCVLICNMQYKNDEIKKILGNNGTPLVLVTAISYYDGSDQKNVLRCLSSIFKAISNTCLYTPNAEKFVEANIHIACKELLEQTGPAFPDDVLCTILYTMDTLVLRNHHHHMKVFGVCLPSLIKLAQQHRSNTRVLSQLVDIIINISRYPLNARVFVEGGGVESVCTLVKQFHYDLLLQMSIMKLLTLLVELEENPNIFIDAGIFSIIINCCEIDTAGNERTDLAVSGLRCCTALMRNLNVSLLFTEAGGITSINNIIANGQNQCVLSLQAYRLLIALLVRAQPAYRPQSALVRRLTTRLRETEETTILRQLTRSYSTSFLPKRRRPKAVVKPKNIEELEFWGEVGEEETGWSEGDETEKETEDEEETEEGGSISKSVRKHSGSDTLNKHNEDLLRKSSNEDQVEGWVKLGLTESVINSVIASICSTLSSDDSRGQQQLQKAGLGLCAYFAVERMCTEVFLQANLASILAQCIQRFPGERLLVLSCCVLISNVARNAAEFYNKFNFISLASPLKQCIAKCGAAEEEGELKEICQEILKALKTGSSSAFETLQIEYDLHLSDYTQCSYRNGVADLPNDLRSDLKSGGRLKIFVGDRECEQFIWRASDDLIQLEWKLSQEKRFTNRMPVSRIRSINKGFLSRTLKDYRGRPLQKSKAEHVLCIVGPPVEKGEPLQLAIKANTMKERDIFIDRLQQWREAASYDF